MADKFIILGGTGFVGANVAAHLHAKGHSVAMQYRDAARLQALAHLAGQSFAADLADPAWDKQALRNACRGGTAIINLVACGSTFASQAGLRQRLNVDLPLELAEVSAEMGLRLVHTGSTAAFGFPDDGSVADEESCFPMLGNDYAVTKREGCDRLLQRAEELGLEVAILHPGSTIGSLNMKADQRGTIASISQGKMRVYPAGGLCLTGSQDLAAGYLAAATNPLPSREYILGGENISYRDYFEGLARLTGGKAPRIKLPGWIMPLLGSSVHFLHKKLGKESAIDANLARMVSMNLYYSSKRAEQELGYRVTPWRSILKTTVEGLHSGSSNAP